RAGQTTSVDLSSFAERRSAKILPPVSEAFPSAPTCADTVYLRAIRSGQARDVTMNVGSGFVLGEYAPAGQPAGAYTFMSGGYTVPFTLSANAGDPPAVVQLARIDVNDVTVRLNDGTTVTRPGNYTIEAVSPDGQTVLGSTCAAGAPTKTGVTVPA